MDHNNWVQRFQHILPTNMVVSPYTTQYDNVAYQVAGARPPPAKYGAAAAPAACITSHAHAHAAPQPEHPKPAVQSLPPGSFNAVCVVTPHASPPVSSGAAAGAVGAAGVATSQHAWQQAQHAPPSPHQYVRPPVAYVTSSGHFHSVPHGSAGAAANAASAGVAGGGASHTQHTVYAAQHVQQVQGSAGAGSTYVSSGASHAGPALLRPGDFTTVTAASPHHQPRPPAQQYVGQSWTGHTIHRS